MSGITAQIGAAEAALALLKHQAKTATCAEMGEHDWKSIGGRNCGCGIWDACSVPVHVCARCGDCDYGDNDEAAEVVRQCLTDNPPTPEGGGEEGEKPRTELSSP
jgi:hypothetical protein